MKAWLVLVLGLGVRARVGVRVRVRVRVRLGDAHEGLRLRGEAARVRDLLLLGGVRGPQPAELLRGDDVRP